MINTRKLTEALEKKYSLDESWEEEFDDEYDYIMDDDSLSDNEKARQVKLLRQKYNKKNESLNESFVEEWWGQTDEDPFDFAYDYGLTCAKIGRRNDEVLYRFTGSKEDIEQAIKDGYFYSMSEGEDEGHSEDLDESLTTKTPLTVIKGLTGAATGAAIGAEMGHPLLGAASGLAGTLTGDVIWDKYGHKDDDEDNNDSLNESIAGDIIWEKVRDIIREKIETEIIDNLAMVISSEVPEYNPDWCAGSSNQSQWAADKLAEELATELMFELE